MAMSSKSVLGLIPMKDAFFSPVDDSFSSALSNRLNNIEYGLVIDPFDLMVRESAFPGDDWGHL